MKISRIEVIHRNIFFSHFTSALGDFLMRFFFCDAYCVISFRFENYFSFSHIWNVLAFEYSRYYGTGTIWNAYTFRHEWKLHSCYGHISKFLAIKLVMCCGFSTLSIFPLGLSQFVPFIWIRCPLKGHLKRLFLSLHIFHGFRI